MMKIFLAAVYLLILSLARGAEESPGGLERVEPEAVGMDAAVLAEIDTVIQGTIDLGHTPGAVVAIGRGNRLCFLKAYGHRQFYPEKEEMTPDTIFDLASVTKVACTATSLALVIDQGKMAPDDLVTQYFPEFGVKGKEDISVWNLMTHTSGIMDYANQTKGTQAELWKLLCGLGLQYPIGERFDYKDNNSLLLGHIIEKVSGQDLRTFTIENIYRPLGMLDTMFNPDGERRKRAAATETRGDVWFKGVVNDYRSFHLGGVAGHCGLFSTAPDLALLAAMWLGKGTLVKPDGTKVSLFNEATFEKMIAPQQVSAGVRGLQWDKRSGSENRPWNMSPRAVGHGGWTGTSLWVDPDLDLFVVVLGNRRHPFGKSPNIYPAAARVGVIAVNAILRHTTPLPRPARQAFAALKGKQIALVVDEAEIGRPGGLPERLHQEGVKIASLSYADGLPQPSESLVTSKVFPEPVKIDPLTEAPVYRLTRESPRLLPPSIYGAEAIVFAATLAKDSSEETFHFVINLLGQTLQSAADNGLPGYLTDYPNPLEKLIIEPTDLVDELKPFGIYSRLARKERLSLVDLALKIKVDQKLNLEISILGNQ